jgi:hypothetical protein
MSSIVASGSREMSIRRVGRATFSFMRSRMFVPPAMKRAAGSAAISRTAWSTPAART